MHSLKLFTDVDTGIDDALALVYLGMAQRKGQVKLVGCSTVAGNVSVKQTTINTLRMWEWLKLSIPVAAGAAKPLINPLNTASFIHGNDGLGNSELGPPTSQKLPETAANFILRISREQKGELTLLTTGPLTNIALALMIDPELSNRLKKIVVMGGAATEGNVSAVSEANFANDPEAARIVLNCGTPLTLVSLDVTHQIYLEKNDLEEIEELDNERSRFLIKIIRFISDAYEYVSGWNRCVLHDPLAAGVALEPQLVRTELRHVDIELRGELTRGMSVVDRRGRNPLGEPNVNVAMEVDAKRFKKIFLDSLFFWARDG